MTEQPALLHFAAEAHRRKWAFAEYDSAAFSVLDCIGNEMRAAYDAAQSAAETPDAGSPAPVPDGPGAAATQPAEGIGAFLEASARDGIGEYLGELADALGIGTGNRPDSVREAMGQCLTWASRWRNRAAHQEARAEAAGAKLAGIEALCRDARASAPESVRTPTVAVVRILAIIGSEGGAGNGC